MRPPKPIQKSTIKRRTQRKNTTLIKSITIIKKTRKTTKTTKKTMMKRMRMIRTKRYRPTVHKACQLRLPNSLLRPMKLWRVIKTRKILRKNKKLPSNHNSQRNQFFRLKLTNWKLTRKRRTKNLLLKLLNSKLLKIIRERLTWQLQLSLPDLMVKSMSSMRLHLNQALPQLLQSHSLNLFSKLNRKLRLSKIKFNKTKINNNLHQLNLKFKFKPHNSPVELLWLTAHSKSQILQL